MKYSARANRHLVTRAFTASHTGRPDDDALCADRASTPSTRDQRGFSLVLVAIEQAILSCAYRLRDRHELCPTFGAELSRLLDLRATLGTSHGSYILDGSKLPFVTAPQVEVTLSTGEKVPLKSLYEQERLALIFLRHLGCVFCKEHVAQLRSLKDLNIVFVTLRSPEATEAFRKKMNSPHKFISDPEKKLHGLFNLQRGGLAEVLNPHTIVRTIAALLKGYINGLPQGDAMQLPGVFLIEPDGTVTWEQRARDIADTPPPGEIRQRLRPAQQES